MHQIDVISFDFNLIYTNPVVNKRIFDILKKSKAIFTIKKVIWRYDKDDLDVFEQGNDYEQLLCVEFEYIPY